MCDEGRQVQCLELIRCNLHPFYSLSLGCRIENVSILSSDANNTTVNGVAPPTIDFIYKEAI